MGSFLLALMLVSVPVFAEPEVKPGPAKRVLTAKKGLEGPSSLSALARQLLKRRMARHGSDLLALVKSVILLDPETTVRLAGEIAAEPRLTRPIAGGADDLNAALPERFFVLQDELKSRATDLKEAARGTDTAKLAARLADLTQTCVSCHSAYLEPAAALAP